MPLVEAEDEVQGVGVVDERSTHRSGPFPPGAFCCTPLYSTATRSVALMPVPAFPTHGPISSCCFRALWTVSATGFACDEATSAFTARCNLVCCPYSFLSMLSEAPPSCFRATTPPQLQGLSLLASVGLSPTG